MFDKFERKMTRNEFDNIMKELKKFFDEDKSIYVFTKLMEDGTYNWQTGRFSNKYSLIFNTNVNIILHKSGIDGSLFDNIKQIIEHNEGIEKQYFLFSNYHKDPQMWRIKDMRCIWGMVHKSYKPLQGIYLQMIEKEKEKQKENHKQQSIEQYVEQNDSIELEESDMGTRNYI